MSERSLRIRSIYPGEKPSWIKDQYLKRFTKESNLYPGLIKGAPIDLEHFLDQHSPDNFLEFDNIFTPYTSTQMRENGCGITALHMTLSALSPEYKNASKTVGLLALEALSFHRERWFSVDGIVRGAYVFNPQDGWFHDALIYTAQKYGILGYRDAGLSLENVASEMQGINSTGALSVCLLSVSNTYRKPDKKPTTSHLICVSGFEVGKDGKVSKLCCTDPSSRVSKNAPANNWIEIDEWSRNSFRGRAIILYTTNLVA